MTEQLTTALEWSLKHFDTLSNVELYQILQARLQVFCVEQQCAYQDVDGSDPACWHLVARIGTEVAALTRIVPPGLHYPEASIGRVLTTSMARGTGVGRELMQRSIDACYAQFGRTPIKIGAQHYLEAFYQSLGFVTISDVYDEDGIPHVKMLKS
jgi:ElaA protein